MDRVLKNMKNFLIKEYGFSKYSLPNNISVWYTGMDYISLCNSKLVFVQSYDFMSSAYLIDVYELKKHLEKELFTLEEIYNKFYLSKEFSIVQLFKYDNGNERDLSQKQEVFIREVMPNIIQLLGDVPS